MEIICFHNPDEENGYLSNWYKSKFIVDHVKFSSMEQFMMYQKAITFQDQTIAKEILQTRDSAKIKQMGRQVRNYNDHIWNGIRQIVVYEGLIAKFSQNEELKRLLIHGTLHLNGMDHGEEHVGEGLEIKSPMLKKQEEVLKTFSDVELI